MVVVVAVAFPIRVGRAVARRKGWGSIKRFSTATEKKLETHHVVCASSGTITVDLYNSHALAKPNCPLLIYLPPTGTHLRSKHPSIPSYLLSKDLPLASINYRWNHVAPESEGKLFSKPVPLYSSKLNQDHSFPVPLHDTFHAFSWLIEQYLPDFAASLKPASLSPYAAVDTYTKVPAPRPLLIAGSHLSAALALSLALTECRSSHLTNQIAGVILQDGIFDWSNVATSRPLPDVDMNQATNIRDAKIWERISGEQSEETTESPLMEDKTADLSIPATLKTMHDLKTRLFTNPASAFDTFVSPILNFRSAGVSIPKYFPGHAPPLPTPGDLGGLSLSPSELEDLQNMMVDDTPPAAAAETIEVTRKSALKFPMKGSGLRIPRTLFLVTPPAGKDKTLRLQSEEMAKQMRRSVATHEMKERAPWEEDLDGEAESLERVQVYHGAGEEAAQAVDDWLGGVD